MLTFTDANKLLTYLLCLMYLCHKITNPPPPFWGGMFHSFPTLFRCGRVTFPYIFFPFQACVSSSSTCGRGHYTDSQVAQVSFSITDLYYVQLLAVCNMVSLKHVSLTLTTILCINVTNDEFLSVPSKEHTGRYVGHT